MPKAPTDTSTTANRRSAARRSSRALHHPPTWLPAPSPAMKAATITATE